MPERQGQMPFDNVQLAKLLTTEIPDLSFHSMQNPIGLFGYCDSIKIDLAKYHNYAEVSDLRIVDRIRMPSAEDIAAILRRAGKGFLGSAGADG